MMKRTKVFILISALAVTLVAAGPVAAEKPAKDKPPEPSAELKRLYKFVGNWQGTTIIHKTKQNPKEIRGTHTLSCAGVLGGRFTMSKIEAPDGTTSLHLNTYDVRRKCYRIWSFHSQGFANEFQGKWDSKTKIFTWHCTDKNVPTVTRSWYEDDNTGKWDSEAKDPDGEVIFRMEGKYTRVKKLPKRKDIPADKPAERSAEQKVLDALVGDWKTTTVAPKALWNPKAVSGTGTSSCVRVLGGNFIQSNGKVSGGGTVIYLATYDVRRKSYRMWHFDSRGFAADSTGKWDAKTRTLTMLGKHDNGITTIGKIRVVDKDTVEWSSVTKDRDGKIGFQMKGKNTRVKNGGKKPK